MVFSETYGSTHTKINCLCLCKSSYRLLKICRCGISSRFIRVIFFIICKSFEIQIVVKILELILINK